MSAELKQNAATGAPPSNWKPYPAYKDSGVEWLGKVPEHWEVKKLKYLVKDFLKYGANESAELEDTNLPRYIRITDFGNDGKLKQDTFKSLLHDIAKDYLLENGDILFARSGATVGKTFQFKNHKGLACFAGYLIKATPDEKKVLSDYLYLFTKSNSYDIWKNGIFIQATIQNIGADKYNYLQIPIPPISEQRAIAHYLDDRTRKIASLIEKKQKMIELLKEERAAVINQAVTKGLNPDAPMKDSGIDWLGEVPEHWGVKRLKYNTTKIGSGVTPKGGSETYLKKGIPLLRSQNIQFDRLDFDDVAYISEETHNQMSGSKVYPNDVLLNITGASIGRCHFVPFDLKEANVNQHVCIIRPNNKIITKYLFNYLSSEKGQIQVFSSEKGISREGLTFEQIKNFSIILPQIEEQKSIVQFIESESPKIDSIVSIIERELPLLKEYRTALISEVVTGKIDVREAI